MMPIPQEPHPFPLTWHDVTRNPPRDGWTVSYEAQPDLGRTMVTWSDPGGSAKLRAWYSSRSGELMGTAEEMEQLELKE